MSEHTIAADAARSLTSILAPIERRVLIWVVRRMPSRVNSDHLTMPALAAMLGAGCSYWLASTRPVGLVLVIACLAINWFGDSLDGTGSRSRPSTPSLGFYIDHVLDAFGALFLLGGLGLSGYMSPFVALGLLVAYLMLLVETFLATYTVGTFRMSYFKIGPTELRLLLIVGNLVLLVHPMAEIYAHQYRLFDVGGVVAICGLVLTLGVAVVTNARALYTAEPLRSGQPALQSSLQPRPQFQGRGAGH